MIYKGDWATGVLFRLNIDAVTVDKMSSYWSTHKLGCEITFSTNDIKINSQNNIEIRISEIRQKLIKVHIETFTAEPRMSIQGANCYIFSLIASYFNEHALKTIIILQLTIEIQ